MVPQPRLQQEQEREGDPERAKHAAHQSPVVPGFMRGIHVLLSDKDVDGRDKPGHDTF
jgi:hypothetical protein